MTPSVSASRLRTLGRRLASLAMVAGSLCAATPSLGIAQEAACFSAADKAPFPIMQNAPPPREANQASYDYYPVTIAATAQIAPLNRPYSPGVQGAYWAWANHGPRRNDGGYKGNITPGSPGVQIRFSSNEAANQCTRAQTAALLGADPASLLQSAGLRPSLDSQTADTLNVCVLPAEMLPRGNPIVLDYEVSDGRSADETLAFLTDWARTVHAAGHPAYLYTNPVDAPSMRNTQITPGNAPTIAEAFDLVSAQLWSRNRQHSIPASFESQVAIWKTQPSKLMIVFELRDTTLADAAFVHQVMSSGRAGMLNFWRNHAVQGGACNSDANRKIACAALGRCGG